MPTTKTLIFDFDGVIADSLSLFVQIIENFRPRYNLDRLKSKEDIANLFDNNPFKSLSTVLGLSQIEIISFLKDLNKWFQGKTEQLKPFPGIIDVLKKIHSKKCKMYIVSSNHTEVISGFLKRNGADEIFEKILGGDDKFNKSEKIMDILKIVKTKTDDVIFICDTCGDVADAKISKVKTAVVTWGFHNKQKLLSANPDIIINSPDDLISLAKD